MFIKLLDPKTVMTIIAVIVFLLFVLPKGIIIGALIGAGSTLCIPFVREGVKKSLGLK